jgi:hypothetical protein
VGPRAGLDGCGKSRPPTGIQSPDRPARNESLYRLSYPGPSDTGVKMINGVPNLLNSVIFVACIYIYIYIYIKFTYVATGCLAQPGGPRFGHPALCSPSETSSTLTFLNVLFGFR